jgi:CRISPR-associated endonuclease Csn1
MIPLSKLFTQAYQIEHIIPQSRYFDDSFGNKVLCEAAVNQLKDNQLGLEFIKNHQGTKVERGFGKITEILSEDSYRKFIAEHYVKNRSKRTKLLLEEIPDKMVERQLNDTRYISKFISNVLSNVVRAVKDDDGINSKNIIPTNGRITSTLKQDWGFNDVWNELILPRFERMNQLTNSKDFTAWNGIHQKFLPTVPLGLSKGFQKKRIDHRHHALDALIIACATRDHINLLNNKHAKSNERFDLNRKLRKFEKVQYNDKKIGKIIEKEVPTDFLKPWHTITEDARNELEKIVVSFKQNLRVINKTTNRYEKFVERNGKKVKELIVQTKGDTWAVRKPIHKAFVFGKVDLRRIQVPKDKIIVAIRRSLNPSMDLGKITDTGIQKILRNYLTSKGNNLESAFTSEGLEEMNKNIERYNDNKTHKPIYKVRTFEVGSRFPLGTTGNKKDKYVETADGTNLFFAIYWDEKKQKRKFETIPLNIVIERQKQGLTSVPEADENGNKLLFYLSPNDLVYVPTDDEKGNIKGIEFGKLSGKQIKRIFVVNDFSGTCYFAPNHIAKSIAPKEVDLNFDAKKNKLSGSYDTKTASFEGKQIKDECIKLKVDRLGNISLAH